jgi:hypothetical protein
VQRLREAAATLPDERVSMQTMAQAHVPEAQGTLLLLMAVPGLLPLPGVGTLLALAMAGLTLFVTAGPMLMTWVWGSQWIMRWVSM